MALTILNREKRRRHFRKGGPARLKRHLGLFAESHREGKKKEEGGKECPEKWKPEHYPRSKNNNLYLFSARESGTSEWPQTVGSVVSYGKTGRRA